MNIRHITAAVIAITAAVLPSHAQTMDDVKRSTSTPLTLSCRMMKQNNQQTVNYRSSWGSSDIDTSRQSVYQLMLRWGKDEPQKVTIEEIYIVSASKKNFVHGSHERTVTLEPKKSTEIAIVTPQIDGNRTQFVLSGYNSEAGATLKGIVVRVKIDDKIVKVYASDGAWSKLAWLTPFTLEPKI